MVILEDGMRNIGITLLGKLYNIYISGVNNLVKSQYNAMQNNQKMLFEKYVVVNTNKQVIANVAYRSNCAN